MATLRAAQQRRPGRRVRGRESRAARSSARARRERVLEDRERRDPDAAADEERPPARPAARVKPRPSGPSAHSSLARAQLAQPPRAGADVLEQEVRLAVAAGGRPRRRAAGRAARSSPPPQRSAAREHRELAGLGALGRRDRRRAARGRRRAASMPVTVSSRRAEAGAAMRRSLTPSRPRAAPAGTAPRGSPSRRALAIARAAETPAESVVRQGIPCITAARRISQPSVRAPTPVGVLTTRSTSPRSIQSSTCGEPSPILFRRCDRHAHARDRLGGAARRDDPKAVVVQDLRDRERARPCRSR